ncbi:ABC transporter substrate-binding protein [Rhodococcoides corynebacterioides]|uniref:ABC transporter substrate-binding protein n=1 Tax=Rhodococcoides corynebacterioides TaxID=53972 RepID=A0ABS7P294_9NOCA|nr:ABC transporter substrate-binding protein [Rhodococcus corynebacterioides]MBY6366497.1 ABC transporter substrate-binding protein [Rhodococcus corynebacterioides]MBY6407097.1 ABC transporter substrate-binding protein [Rhodococcus corynebacterioides]
MRTHRLLLAAALAATLGASACSSGPGPDADPANPVSIDVTVSAAAEIYSIPWLVAQQQGLFEKHGVIVENIVPGKGGSATMRTLLDGNIPIGEVSYPSIVQADAGGSELRIVGGGTQGPYPMNFYALASNSSIQSIDDVRRWAYTRPNSASDALTRLLPSLAGADADRIERVSTGGIGEGLALLEAGSVDIALIPSIVAEQRPDDFRLIVSSPDYLERFLQSTITTTKDYAASNPGVVRAINAGYTEAVESIRTDPDAAARIYAAYTGFDVPAALAVVERASSVGTWGGGFDPAAIESAQAGVEASGSDRDPDFCTLFDPDFLPEGAATDIPGDCA